MCVNNYLLGAGVASDFFSEPESGVEAGLAAALSVALDSVFACSLVLVDTGVVVVALFDPFLKSVAYQPLPVS